MRRDRPVGHRRVCACALSRAPAAPACRRRRGPAALPDGVADVLAVLRSSGDRPRLGRLRREQLAGRGRERAGQRGRTSPSRAARPGSAGSPRRRDPRGRAGAAEGPGRRRRPRRRRPASRRSGSEHVLLLVEDRTEARRRRGDPARLRRQRQPRAEDPGRRRWPCWPRPSLDAHDDPEAVRRFAQRMQVESHRLTRLVQEIVELSRLQVADLAQRTAPGRPRPTRSARPWTGAGWPPRSKDIEIALVTGEDC